MYKYWLCKFELHVAFSSVSCRNRFPTQELECRGNAQTWVMISGLQSIVLTISQLFAYIGKHNNNIITSLLDVRIAQMTLRIGMTYVS